MRTLPSGEAATQITNPITTVTVTTYTQPTLAPTQPTMVSIVPAALSGAKIAHREKARIINEEIIRTCQLTLGPLRSAIVGPSWSISALVLGWTLVFAYHAHIAALASAELFPIHCRFGTFVSREAVVMRLSHAYTLSFHVRLFKFLSHARKSHSPVRRRGSEAQACERGHVNAFSN